MNHQDKKCVMIVEDDEDIREVIADILESRECDVISAAHGKEALECLRIAMRLPDIILLDLMMPIMDGWQFRSEQIANERISSIPVVVISAHGKASDYEETFGAVRWLEKPIDISDLLWAVGCGDRSI